MLAAFLIWTLATKFVDVQAISAGGTNVGFATVNRYIHSLTGVNMPLYVLTDRLGLVPIAIAGGFAVIGSVQWLNRKSIFKVDLDIIALGIFYAVVILLFFFFEAVVINYRPILIEGNMEASYPSSTTMLVMCVMPTTVFEIKRRIRHNSLRRFLVLMCFAFTVFMVTARLLSGVHWLSDIIGGALLSTAMVSIYIYVCNLR